MELIVLEILFLMTFFFKMGVLKKKVNFFLIFIVMKKLLILKILVILFLLLKIKVKLFLVIKICFIVIKDIIIF